MEKNHKETSCVVLSKEGYSGKEKILFKFTSLNIIKSLLCFVIHFARVFSSMSPFGISFYAAIFTKDSWVVNFIISLIGCIFSGNSMFLNYGIVTVAITAIFAVWDKPLHNSNIKAILCSTIFVLFGVIRFINTGFVTFDILALILEALLIGIGIIIFSHSWPIFINFKKRTFISSKESLCVYASMAIIILVMNSLPNIARLNPASVVSMVIIFIMCSTQSHYSAVTLAIMLGVIGSMQANSADAITGTYAFGALLSGSMKKYGKTGVILGFVIASTVSSLFLTDTEHIIMSIYDSIAAGIIFVFIPGSVIKYFELLSSKANGITALRHTAASEDKILKKLGSMSDSLSDLARIYENACNDREAGKSYFKKSINAVSSKVCVGCHKKDRCFSENGPAHKAINQIITSSPSKISPAQLPAELKNICHRCDSFSEAALYASENVKNEMLWLAKVNESRKLISHQLDGLSSAIRNETEHLKHNRNSDLEEKLWLEFDCEGLYPTAIYADEKIDGNFDIEVHFDCKNVDKYTVKHSLSCVEKATGCNAEFAGTKKIDNEMIFAFCPREGYSASFGYATKAKHGEKVCGDSFNVIYTGRNKMVMALSDGMGSGEAASAESRTTINLLEKFLQAGFNCDTAINLINSSLLIKGAKDTFATIDICDINLSDASLVFTKLGAAAAYIKTGTKTVKISGRSLPAGILKDADGEKHMLPISGDTVVVLMSDGVADIALKNPAYEGWIEKELSKISGNNPQIIAGRLIDTAYRLQDKVTRDDMTVLIACITKTGTKV